MRIPLEVLLGTSVVATAAVVFLLRRRWSDRRDPESLRRDLIESRGRLIEGMALEFHDSVVVYTWSWRGVDYQASQDLRQLVHLLPASTDHLIGPVTVKFLPANPANSIVLSENWNGFAGRWT